jgi:hypothetical protein
MGSELCSSNTNQNAVVHIGWGPMAHSYYMLLHPEIASSKPVNQPASMNTMVTNVPASDLNLSGGLVGTLIDRIIVGKKKREA